MRGGMRKSQASVNSSRRLLHLWFEYVSLFFWDPKLQIGHFTTRPIILVGSRKHGQADPALRCPALCQGVFCRYFSIHKNVGIRIFDDQGEISLRRVIKLNDPGAAGGGNRARKADGIISDEEEDFLAVEEHRVMIIVWLHTKNKPAARDVGILESRIPFEMSAQEKVPNGVLDRK